MPDDGDKQTQKIEPVKIKPLSKLPYDADDDPNAAQKDRWRTLERNREVLSKNPDDLGFIKTGPGASIDAVRVAKVEEEKKTDRVVKHVIKQTQEWLNEQTAQWLTKSLDNFIDQTQGEIDALQRDIERLRDEIKALEERQEELLERRMAMEKALAEEKIELDADGKPKDPALRKFFEERKKRTGEEPDYTDTIAVLTIIQKEGLPQTDKEIEQNRQEIVENEKKIQVKEQEKGAKEQIKAEAEEILILVKEGKLNEAAELVKEASPDIQNYLLSDPECPEELKKVIKEKSQESDIKNDGAVEGVQIEEPSATVVAEQDLNTLRPASSSFAAGLEGGFGGVLQNSLNIKSSFQAAVSAGEKSEGQSLKPKDKILAKDTQPADGPTNSSA